MPPYHSPSAFSRAEESVARACRFPPSARSRMNASARSLVRSISAGIASQWLIGSTYTKL